MGTSPADVGARRDEGKRPATRRILDASRELVARGGAAEVSMGDVAARAGVSKALVHYHFRDKDSLLQTLVEDVGTRLVARARRALEDEAAPHALDVYWTWIESELRLGDLRTLIALGEYDSERVRLASRTWAEERRRITAEHVATLFSRLGLTPTVPAAMIADTVLAFLEGLAVAYALHPEADPRPSFDVLWLALLNMTE